MSREMTAILAVGIIAAATVSCEPQQASPAHGAATLIFPEPGKTELWPINQA